MTFDLYGGHGPAVGPPSPRLRAAGSLQASVRDATCRAVLLGLTGVGKTALTVRLLTKRFIGEYCPTLESMYSYHENSENEEVKIEIFDTAGITADDPVPETYAFWGNCFVFVYAINDRRSFDEVARLKRRVEAMRGSECSPCLLVGNKSDLEYERRVRRYEGQRLARLLRCTHFFETSACDGNHVGHIADMFHTLYRDFRRHRAVVYGGAGLTPSGVSPAKHPPTPSRKFRHAIQKVMMRSKSHTPKNSKMMPTRESIV